MATDPQFAATPNTHSVLAPATADTSLTAPTNVATLWTPGANGGRVDWIRVLGVGATVAGRLNVFRYDGTSYWLLDQIMVNAVTPSASVEVFEAVVPYGELLLDSGDSLRITVMEAGNESLLCVTAIGGNF
jgi:hypothetical protein